MDVEVGLAEEFVRFVGSVLIDGLGYATARFLFPLLSFGWVRIDDAPSSTVSHNWFGFRSGADGAVLLQRCTASLLGVFSWFVGLALVLAIVH